MRLPKQVANPVLAALIVGAGFPSRDRFAGAVNLRGWRMHGVKLNYDHVSVKHWLGGSICQNPDVVAAVLSDAWGIPIPVQVIWPELRAGSGPVPAHLQAWVAARTLQDLGAFIGSDMLTRRETLASAVGVATGPALLAPLTRWLGMRPVGLAASTETTRRIGMSDVAGVEEATKYFAAVDAQVGGGLSREAAVGQLKYAVDLLRYSTYSDAVGNRLLAAVAGLSGLVGWMCLDSGMHGPAQRYLIYGLQAARESIDPRALLLAVRILSDMGQQMRLAGNQVTALRLHELALSQLPLDRSRFNLTRAVTTCNKAFVMSHLGLTCLPEVRSAVGLAVDLYAQATDEEYESLRQLPHRSIDVSEPELTAITSAAHLVLAKDDRRLARDVEERTLHALANLNDGYGRNKILAQVRLARARLVIGEVEQACDDGDQALAGAGTASSWMIHARLRELFIDTESYKEFPRVQEFRERLRAALQ